jgi:hypothetical protein
MLFWGRLEMTAINATVMSAAAASMPSQGSGSNNYGPALYSTPVLTENPGAGYGVDAQTADNATNGLVTAPATVVGIGMSNGGVDATQNPTTTTFNAGQPSFAASNLQQPEDVIIAQGKTDLSFILPATDAGYTLGTVGPGSQPKTTPQPQGGSQFESAAPAAAVQPILGPGSVFVDTVSPVLDNPATPNSTF